MKTPAEVLSEILKSPKDLNNVQSLVAPDVKYVSLNYRNDDLHSIMPWCGTQQGAASIVQTFVDVERYWEVLSFETEALFGDLESAAMFGRFTYRSRRLGKEVTSPFAVFAKVRDGLCHHLQFMEDTLATSDSFRSSGTWKFQSNPNGEVIEF
jgi:ketosteroid isomerase-like protein